MRGSFMTTMLGWNPYKSLNLTFDEVCIDYYSLRKYKVCVEGSIHVHFQLFYVINFHLTKQSN